ncbi:hypothetical protein K3495_g9107 [Podosphaera aphanis]|nr:hypothetical protein K3495_g9107 [Podosphaera aphanis]
MRVSLIVSVITTLLSLAVSAKQKQSLMRRDEYLKLGTVTYEKLYIRRVAAVACSFLKQNKQPFPRPVLGGQKFAIQGDSYLEFPLTRDNQVWSQEMPYSYSELLVINNKCKIVGGMRLTTVVMDASEKNQIKGKVAGTLLGRPKDLSLPRLKPVKDL